MSRAGARHGVLKSRVDRILCHRIRDGTEQYLIRWTSIRAKDVISGTSQNAVVSWHPVGEIFTVTDLLQTYVTRFKDSLATNGSNLYVPTTSSSLKRKSPHDEETSSSVGNTPDRSFSSTAAEPNVWNGVLQRRMGDIYPKELVAAHVPRIDATTLPTPRMVRSAARWGNDGIRQARNLVLGSFKSQIARLPGAPVSFHNSVDKETPSLSFTWVQDYVYGPGVSRADADEVKMGCSKCRPDMGGNKGCEYTQICECLEYAAPDPKRCNSDEQQKRLIAWKNGIMDASGLPKRFPYRRSGNSTDYVLDPFYLESRNVIYECNEKCRCGKGCKNRMVQHGRQVPLEIFKTEQRGFGLRCPVLLKRGQFIDKYLGELITDPDADAREASSGPGKASYLFWLDKHANDDDPLGLKSSDCYVADGERMGGPTRFINHSCDPNCRLFTVSYNKNDLKIYDLAFFALYDIPANEELTFDYLDPEEGEAGLAETEGLEQGSNAVDCLCGAENCRGKLWM